MNAHALLRICVPSRCENRTKGPNAKKYIYLFIYLLIIEGGLEVKQYAEMEKQRWKESARRSQEVRR